MKYVFLVNISQFDVPKVEKLFTKESIEFIIKSPYQSSLAGGWITPGSSFHEHAVFVNSLKFEQAVSLLEINQ
tara:strand:- start:359 stop:577 length:219 start_codon:yes stop_codon:yes gene_type:complete